jgi:hypothetical protein
LHPGKIDAAYDGYRRFVFVRTFFLLPNPAMPINPFSVAELISGLVVFPGRLPVYIKFDLKMIYTHCF